jgi:hypothetical protein
MLLYILVVPVALCLLVGMPMLVKSAKKGRVFLWEYLTLICPVLIWYYLTLKSVGAQSLSNISEVYLVAVASIAYSYFRMRKPDLPIGQKIFGVVFLLSLPLAFRLLFPVLPE